MEPHRAERVSEALREELAEIVEYELSDPRLTGVTVTGVHVTPDLKHAHILVAGAAGADQETKVAEALEHATPFLRRELAARLRLWRIPELHFQTGAASQAADRVEELLARVRKNRKKDAGGDEK